MNIRAKIQIRDDINRIERILSSEIFDFENRKNPLREAAFRELMICLRDLIWKADKYGSRISFTDDVILDSNLKIADVTDLIKFMRDTISHPETKNTAIPDPVVDATISLAVLYGKVSFYAINNILYSSDYEDEICFYFGTQRIYLRRHIIRALEEAKAKLLPLL